MNPTLLLPWLCVLAAVAPLACGGQASTPGSAHDAGATSDGASSPPSSDASPSTDSSTADTTPSPSADGGAPNSPPGFVTVLQSGGCLPQHLPAGSSGEIACEVYEVLPGSAASCDAALGQSSVDPTVVAAILDGAGVDASALVCAFQQIAEPAGSGCTTSTTPGWCYATGAGAEGCPQKIEVSPGQPPAGAVLVLACPNP